jgi:hypothetical protein
LTNFAEYQVWWYPETASRNHYSIPAGDRELVYQGQNRTYSRQVQAWGTTPEQHGYFYIQAIDDRGREFELTETVPYSVLRKTDRPLPPSAFTVNIVGNTTAEMTWQPSPSIDVVLYEVRYSPRMENAVWGSSETLFRVPWTTTSGSAGARTGSYLIRAVDSSGNESITVTQVTAIDSLPNLNLIAEIEEAPDWLGVKDGFVKVGDKLQMSEPEVIDPGNNARPYQEAVYTFDERLDLGDVFGMRLTSKWQAEGFSESVVIADWPTMAVIDPIAGVTRYEDWDGWLEYRLSSDNGATWTDWRAFTVVDVVGQIVEFRLKGRTYRLEAGLLVLSSLVEIDMEDRIWSKSDIQIEAGGSTVLIEPPFKHLEAVAVTIDGADGFRRYEVSDKQPGSFKVTLFDADNNSVAGKVDCFASGYGVQY